MQKKLGESCWMTQWLVDKKKQYFALYVIGLLVYGVGSSFLLNKTFLEAVFLTSRGYRLKALGVLCLLTGMSILIFIFYQFYKRVVCKRKIAKALVYYVLLVVLSGILLGCLGKVLYDYLGRDYKLIKQVIWILTTLIQGMLRFIFIYYCLMTYQSTKFEWKSKRFLKMLLGICLLLSFSIVLSIVYPIFSSPVMFLSDMIIATSSVYVEGVKLKKESCIAK